MSATFRWTCPMSTRGSIEEAKATDRAYLGAGEPLPEVPHQLAHDRIPLNRAREPERSGGEHLRPGRRLVVGHLGRKAGPEDVRDLGEHLDAVRRLRAGLVDLDPAAPEGGAVAQAGTG